MQAHHDVHIDILDVTLRDGGYVNNHEFAYDDIDGIFSAIAGSGIPYVEIGYFRPWRRPDDAPVAARSSAAHIAHARGHLVDARIVCMIHPTQLEPRRLHELAAHGVDAIRLVTTPATLDGAAAHVAAALEAGMLVSINLIRASELDRDTILSCGRAAERMGATWFYVADSNSGLYPEQVGRIFEPLRDQLTIRLGFHAHDGLRLAFANTLVAIGAGATLVDGSLGGMGKGGGNLPTELIAAYLARNVSDRYRIAPLAAAVERHIQKWVGQTSTCEAVLGALLDLNIDGLRELKEQARTTRTSLLALLEERARRPMPTASPAAALRS